MRIDGVDTSRFYSQNEIISRLIREKDSDGDGSLSFEEFRISEEKFNKIDVDSNGTIDQEEFKNRHEQIMIEQSGSPTGGMLQLNNSLDFKDIHDIIKNSAAKYMKKADEDKDGTLSIEEFVNLKSIFNKLDIDNNGSFNLDGFIAAHRKHALISTDYEFSIEELRKLEDIFNKLDTNKSGSVDQEDFSIAYKKHGLELLADTLPLEKYRSLQNNFHEFNINNDDFIDQEEFTIGYKKYVTGLTKGVLPGFDLDKVVAYYCDPDGTKTLLI